jgi:hypothetical protein
MKALLSGAIDGGAPVKLSGQVPEVDLESWQAEVTSTLSLFDAFVAAGGLPSESRTESWLAPPGQLVWERNRFTHTWPLFPSGAVGLAVALRMLDHLQRGGLRLGFITIRGTPINPNHPMAISRLESVANQLPPRFRSLLFQLQLEPYSDWLNILCELNPTFPPEVPPALNDAIWAWGQVVNAGGFQVVDETLPPNPSGKFGVGIDGPVVGDDFLEWYCLKAGVPVGSVNGLVNVLAVFSMRTFPLHKVVIS